MIVLCWILGIIAGYVIGGLISVYVGSYIDEIDRDEDLVTTMMFWPLVVFYFLAKLTARCAEEAARKAKLNKERKSQ